MKNTNTAKATQTQTNTFVDLLRNYEQATREKATQPAQYEKALLNLAQACTFSVLKKLCNVGTATEKTSDKKPFKTKGASDTAKVIRTLRQGARKDIALLANTIETANKTQTTRYNKDGDIETVIDTKENEALNTLINECLTDGIDLIHTAVVAILEQTAKADTTTDFMETPYTIRRLKKKVYIKKDDSVNGWETKETTPIQEVFKAVRREVENNRSMQVLNGKYTYLETVIKDSETDTEETVYKRLPKYSQLAYEITDSNGKVTAITSDLQTVTDIEMLIEKLNLTSNQATILQLRLSGYGYYAIGTYLGVTQQAVLNTIKKIQKKAIAIGLNIKGE